MRIILPKVLHLLLLSTHLVGAAKPNGETCQTSFGTKSLSKVPTTTTTVVSRTKSTATITAVETATTTVTPKPVTSTSVAFYTFTTGVVATQTGTYTGTEKIVVTRTKTTTKGTRSTVTVTAVSSYTYTDQSATTTIPTPAGFTPVLLTLPNSKAKRGTVELDIQHEALEKRSRFPAKVICTVSKTTTKVVSTTVTATTTVTSRAARSTVTTSERETVTTTLTDLLPPSLTFTTVTSTTTTITTVTPNPRTTTVTSTSSIPIAANTAYAACAPSSSNFAGTVNYFGSPSGIDDLVVPSGVQDNYSFDIYNPTDCCTACFNNPACLAMGFNQPFSSGNAACHLLTGPQNRTSLGAGTHNVYGADQGYILSNGPVGGAFDHTVYE